MKKALVFVVLIAAYAVLYLMLEVVGRAFGLSYGAYVTAYYVIVTLSTPFTTKLFERKEE